MSSSTIHSHWTRRGVLAATAASALTACSSSQEASAPVPTTNSTATTPSGGATTSSVPRSSADTSSGKTLLVYFSRAGENYYNGGRTNLEVGNTEVLANHVASLISCDAHKIEAADPYPSSYNDCVARNVREEDAQARPEIANPLTSLSGYRTVLIGSPIWNVKAPRIMRTFIDANDFTGITVAPFTTFAMSGLGSVPEEYERACRNAAAITAGLSVRGEEVTQGRAAAEAWLRQIGLL